MATHHPSTRAFAMLVPALGLGVAYWAARRSFMRWGATSEEVDAELPGDDLLGEPTLVTTRAITIDAPVAQVWPWLVQMGQDRGGLYSYDWMENLIGLHFHSVDHIVAQWQTLEVGDQIRTAPPSAGPEAGFTVVRIEPRAALVTAIGDPAVVIPQAQTGRLHQGGTWTFTVLADSDGRTRLIIRLRSRFGFGPLAERVAVHLLEPVHFVMERKQMLGIKQRAERLADRSLLVHPRSGLGGH